MLSCCVYCAVVTLLLYKIILCLGAWCGTIIRLLCDHRQNNDDTYHHTQYMIWSWYSYYAISSSRSQYNECPRACVSTSLCGDGTTQQKKNTKTKRWCNSIVVAHTTWWWWWWRRYVRCRCFVVCVGAITCTIIWCPVVLPYILLYCGSERRVALLCGCCGVVPSYHIIVLLFSPLVVLLLIICWLWYVYYAPPGYVLCAVVAEQSRAEQREW